MTPRELAYAVGVAGFAVLVPALASGDSTWIITAAALIGMGSLSLSGPADSLRVASPRDQMREDAIAGEVSRWLASDEDAEELEARLDDLLFPTQPVWMTANEARMRAELERKYGDRVEVAPVYVIGQEYPVDYIARTKED